MKFTSNPHYTAGATASTLKEAATVQEFLRSVPDAKSVALPLVAQQTGLTEAEAEAAAVALGCTVTDDGLA